MTVGTLDERIEKICSMELSKVRSDFVVDFNGKVLEVPVVLNSGGVVEAILCERYGGDGYLIALSSQVGCVVGCSFCNLSELEYEKNVSSQEIFEEIVLVLNHAKRLNYDVNNLKISFVKGGEGLMNREIIDALYLIKKNLGVPVKISTTFPDIKRVRDNFERLIDFAEEYDSITQIQVSLISTNEEYRAKNVVFPLVPFSDLANYGRMWKEKNERKITLSFTYTKDCPCNPEEIYDVLSPEYFVIRVRGWMSTISGVSNGLSVSEDGCIKRVEDKFQEKGYLVIPGELEKTQERHGLAAGHLIKLYDCLKFH